MNAAKKLEETGSALREAMIQQDWTAISLLDLECRQVVEAAMEEPRRDEAVMRERMAELLELYRDLLDICRAEQKRADGKLIQINQSQKGAKIYKLFG